MFRLIQNERMKLWAKKGTWVMLILLVLATLCYALLVKSTTYHSPDWRADEESNISYSKEYLNDPMITEEEKVDVEQSIQISEYRLANDMPPLTMDSTDHYLLEIPTFMFIVMLFGVIVASTILSSEFNKGTIKMLLTRPVSRANILTSKLLATFEFAIILTVVAFVLNVLFAYLLFDRTGGATLLIENGEIVRQSIWPTLGRNFAFESVMVIMSILFAFMISTITRSSSLAIGITIFITMASSLIAAFFYKFKLIQFIWFAVMDLESIYEGEHMLDVSLSFALTIQLIYAIVFIVISYVHFMKSDVTA